MHLCAFMCLVGTLVIRTYLYAVKSSYTHSGVHIKNNIPFLQKSNLFSIPQKLSKLIKTLILLQNQVPQNLFCHFLYLELSSDHILSDIRLCKAHLKILREQPIIVETRRTRGHLGTWRSLRHLK